MPVVKSRKLKIGIGIALIVLVAATAFVLSVGIRLTRRSYTVPPSARRILVTPRDALGPGTITVSILNSEGYRTPGWYRPADPTRSRGAIVLLHGLCGTRAQLAPIAKRLRKEGWGVLLIDQRGHGESPRDLTTFGPAEAVDALAAIQWLRERPEVDPNRIGLYGASLGGATCIYAASQDPFLACAVADSSYAEFEKQAYHDLNMDKSPIKTSYRLQPSVVRIFLSLSCFVIGKWAHSPDPVDVVADIKCPLFLIHGERDSRIDPASLDELADAARRGGVDVTTWVVQGKGHCGYHNSDEFLSRLVAFFHEHLDSPDR